MSQGYIKEATYKFSDLYLPGMSSNSWGRGGQTKRDTLVTDRQTDGMQLYIYRSSPVPDDPAVKQVFGKDLEIKVILIVLHIQDIILEQKKNFQQKMTKSLYLYLNFRYKPSSENK
jgi:hypothetical protein